MNRRSAVVSIVAVAGLLAAAALSPVLAGGKGSTVTNLTIVDPPASPIEGSLGDLRVKFAATRSVINGWFDIEASFRPDHLVHTRFSDDGNLSGIVRGEAKATVLALQPGSSAAFVATGMRMVDGTISRALAVNCTITVDSAGHVSVLGLTLFLL